MKIFIKALIIITIILLQNQTFGQKTYLDLKINIVSNNLDYGKSNSNLKDYQKPLKALQIGAAFQAGITPHFSIVPELYYIRKGGQLKKENPLTNQESSIQFNTLEMPILARFHFGKVYINGGPSFAYYMNGKQKNERTTTNIVFENSEKGFKRFEAGVQAGGGIEIPLKQRRIAIDFRYNYGLTNISNGQERYNRSFMVSILYSKPWKKTFGK